MKAHHIRTLAVAFCLVVWFGVFWLAFHPHHFGADAPAVAYIECDAQGCQINIVKPGYETQEYWVASITYEEK